MLQTIENQGDENYNPKEGPHSTSAKSSNENTPNIPKKSLQLNTKISMTKIQSKNDINQIGKYTSVNKAFNNKSKEGNIIIIDANISQNSNDEQNNKKDFIEKKRRRRNKCSYSNCRNKKSKRTANIHQLSQPKNNKMLTTELIYQNIPTKKSSIIELKEDISEEKERQIEKADKRPNENNPNNKKKIKVDEKEVIANAEKKFMENLNKQYSDEQFNKDLDMNLKEKRVQFMKENFPIMFRKDKYYLYTVLLKKRRTQPINFIQPNTLTQDIQESRKHQTLYLNEEQEHSDHVLSENSDEVKIQTTKNKNKNISNQNKFGKNQKTKIKSIPYDSEIIPSINQKKNNKSKEEMDQMKQDLIDPKQPIQEKNKKLGTGFSDTSPSEHEQKNVDINHIIDDIEEQNIINKNGIKFKKTYTLLPKHIWSLPKDKIDLDIEMFYDDCIQIWPHNQCIFVKEIALEFLMKNNYSTELCLKRIKDFVSFMKKRAEELNISIINKNEKTVKKYSLRNTKTN
jgi:hypothetical protein